MSISNFARRFNRRLTWTHLLILFVLALGTVGFHLIEGLSFLDSIYLTTTTVTTIGYGDVVPTTRAGKAFAVFLALFGVGTVLYALSMFAQYVVQSQVLDAMGLRRRNREMDRLSNHFIICGAGRVGRKVIKSLKRDGFKFVVIEFKPEAIAKLGDDVLVVEGDATLDENLKRAGVERAAGIATCLSDDAKNVYVVLTARHINPTIHIVARADEEQAEPKLIRAGANRVVSPIIIGGQGMARSLTRPAIADFMDSIIAENLDLVFEEIQISPGSKFIGCQLKDADISRRLNLLIVAIRRKDGEMIFNPDGTAKIKEGDLLIVIGKAEGVKEFLQK